MASRSIDPAPKAFANHLDQGGNTSVAFIGSVNDPEFVQTICAMANTKGGTIYVGAQARIGRRHPPPPP